MTKPYLDLIDEKIADLEREIAKLAIARGVIEEMTPRQAPVPKLSAPKRAAPKRTANNSKQNRQQASLMRADITKILKTALVDTDYPMKSMTSREIFERLPEETANLKAMWNTIYNMKAKGTLVRLNDGTYALPPAVQQ